MLITLVLMITEGHLGLPQRVRGSEDAQRHASNDAQPTPSLDIPTTLHGTTDDQLHSNTQIAEKNAHTTSNTLRTLLATSQHPLSPGTNQGKAVSSCVAVQEANKPEPDSPPRGNSLQFSATAAEQHLHNLDSSTGSPPTPNGSTYVIGDGLGSNSEMADDYQDVQGMYFLLVFMSPDPSI